MLKLAAYIELVLQLGFGKHIRCKSRFYTNTLIDGGARGPFVSDTQYCAKIVAAGIRSRDLWPAGARAKPIHPTTLLGIKLIRNIY